MRVPKNKIDISASCDEKVRFRYKDQLRRKMVKLVAYELYAHKKYITNNIGKKWLLRLPTLSRQLECYLYQNARNLQEYSDITTLLRRLVHVAFEVHLLRIYKKVISKR
jgi:hypothetical protein